MESKKKKIKKTKKNKKSEKKIEKKIEEKNNSENSIQEEPIINVRLSFLLTIRKMLMNISPRVNWHHDELLPAGLILRDLNSIANKFTPKIDSK